MRIKQLEVIGFKSFGQKTVLEFPAGVTAIVGPNGCGKSNVVDAIRWVLGEQSPKQLRGASMEDVIFSGNDRIPAAGMAQVSLTFENDANEREPTQLDLDISTLPAQFRNLTEIRVTRRYFRSGESEYLINKTPCRLKDITELFLGTGVGSKAYAVIEQGRVEQLINARPEDRRLFIEEAAGTTLYRSRKLAAERKIERTRENLLRVNDVLRELERQIQYLHRMAKKAEQYRRLHEELRALDLSVSGAQWRRMASAILHVEAELDDLRRREQGLAAALLRQEDARAAKVGAQATAEGALAHRREAAATLDAACESLRQRAELVAGEASERERRIGKLRAQAAALAVKQQQATHTLAATECDRAAGRERLLADEAQLAAREAEFVAARATIATVTAAVEQERGRLVALASREAECRNAMADHARRRDEARRRSARLEIDHAEASQRLADLEKAVESRRVEAASLRERVRATEGEKERRAGRVRGLVERRRALDGEASEAQGLLLQLRSRLESMQQLQQNYEGYQRGVRSILLEQESSEGVLGVVADVIDVPEQYERAVAAALGDRLQYVIVRQENDGLDAVNALRSNDSGRGSFIPLSPRHVLLEGGGARSLNGNAHRLLDLVEVDDRYREVAESLLAEVVLVPDLDSGLALWRRNGVHVTMVTPEGDVIDATGVITGGSERPLEEEMVSRRRLVGELSGVVAAADARLRDATTELQGVGAELETEEISLRALDRDLHALTLELVAAEKDVERLEGERPRWLDRVEVVRFEAAAAVAEGSEHAADVAQIETKLAALMEERQQSEHLLRARQEEAAGVAARVDAIGADVTSTKVRVAERRQTDRAAADLAARLQRELEDLVALGSASVDEIDRTSVECAELQASAADAEAQRLTQRAQHEVVEAAIVEARAVLEEATRALAEHDRSLHETRTQLEAVRAACGPREITLAEQRLRAAHLGDGVRERYDVDIAEVIPDPDFVEDDAAVARLDGLRDKIKRIGDVSVGAIDELRELEERATFLRTQKEDLDRSVADLEKTIQRLNRASRSRFLETFEAVNRRFQQVVPQLFRGGEARLVLTDEQNIMESGVDLVLRPPGKRLETITLLSGGEKALGAVSLIVALFLINPTPFCILDEVDAPLDDANIGRFTTLVKDMSEHSQFIMITHNKHSMQAAGALYGVTMQEPGLSKVISVAMQ